MRQQPGRLRDVLRRYRIRLASGLLALIAAGVAGAGNPLLIKVMLDRGLYPPDGVRQRTVILIALAMVGLAVAAATAGLVATYFGEGVIHAYVRDLRTELFGSLARLPLAELQTRRMGELSARFVGDLGLIESVLENAGMGLVSNGLFLLASIAAMAYLSIPLCLGSLALTPLLVWLTRRIAARQATLTGQLQEEVGALAVVVDDNLSSAGAIQARLFDRVPASVAGFGGIADRLYRLQLRRAMLLGRLDASLGVFFAAVPALVYVGAGYAIAGGHAIDIGSLVAYVALQTRFFGPIGQVMQLSAQLAALPPVLRRVAEYQGAEYQGAEALSEQRGTAVEPGPAASEPEPVTVRGLGFGYPTDGFRLRAIDLDLPAGSRIAIVGESGSGKSTLALLLAGLLAPDEGTVTVGTMQAHGPAIAELLRGTVGLVTQVPHVLHASVAANISFGRPDATPAEIVAAARAASLHEFIESLPDGYDTLLGQGGARLSGGQRQRLCVARVALVRPSVIVFDETGSALDRTTQASMWTSIRTTLAPATHLVISHDEDTVAQCELVYRLAGGSLVEAGDHHQLLRTSADYRSFWAVESPGAAS